VRADSALDQMILRDTHLVSRSDPHSKIESSIVSFCRMGIVEHLFGDVTFIDTAEGF
jgi:hypothetical protein